MLSTETVDIRRAASLLNRCVEINLDGPKCPFRSPPRNARAPSLKEMFQRYALERARFVGALQTEIVKAGLVPENEGTLGGAARRQLMEVIQAFQASHRDLQIIREAVNELQAAWRVYATMNDVMDTLPIDLRVLIEEQRTMTQTEARRNAPAPQRALIIRRGDRLRRVRTYHSHDASRGADCRTFSASFCRCVRLQRFGR